MTGPQRWAVGSPVLGVILDRRGDKITEPLSVEEKVELGLRTTALYCYVSPFVLSP